jgi:hypothetical protein
MSAPLPPKKTTLQLEKISSSQSKKAQLPQKKTTSSPFDRVQPLLSYEKTDAKLEASTRLEAKKWIASFKKTPTPKSLLKT